MTTRNIVIKLFCMTDYFCKYGKFIGDKGYIWRNLFMRLFVDGISLITKLKRILKWELMSLSDKLLLRKRAISKTAMTNSRILHRWNITLPCYATVALDSRHMTFDNFFVNLLSAMQHTFAFRRSRLSMLRGRLTHSGLCTEFVELTLFTVMDRCRTC